MKTLKCREVSGQNCDFAAEAFTKGGAKKSLKRHGMEVHADMMQNLNETEKTAMETKMDELLG